MPIVGNDNKVPSITLDPVPLLAIPRVCKVYPKQ